jgi:hypothetical protein
LNLERLIIRPPPLGLIVVASQLPHYSGTASLLFIVWNNERDRAPGKLNGISASPSRSLQRPKYRDAFWVRKESSPRMNSSAISAMKTLGLRGHRRRFSSTYDQLNTERPTPITSAGCNIWQSFRDVQSCDFLPYSCVIGGEVLLDHVPDFGVLTIVATLYPQVYHSEKGGREG